MPNRPVSLHLFKLMPQEEKLAHVMVRGVPLPDRSDPLVMHYALDDFYVRVRIEVDPLRVVEINADQDALGEGR